MLNATMSRIYFVLCFCLMQNLLIGQAAYQIEIQIDNYTSDEIYFSFFRGGKQYLKDTLYATAPQQFLIKGKKALQAGVYAILLGSDQKRIPFIISRKDQFFKIKTDSSAQVAQTIFRGSDENEAYYQYLLDLEKKENRLEELNRLMDEDSAKAGDYMEEKELLHKKSMALQREMVEDWKGSILADLIRMEWEPERPTFKGDPAEELAFVQNYTKEHYFDHMDLSATHFLRLPAAYQKVDYFINGLYTADISPLSLEYPKAIKTALSTVLDKMKANRSVFKFYLTHFINKYGKAKVVGFDDVFVHLVERYVLSGEADWVTGSSLETVTKLASRRKPVLNGRIAANVEMQEEDGTKIKLHDIEAKYMVLVFWRPNCGHCKKAIAHLKTFYQKHKEEGVKIFAACTWLNKKTPKCWEDAKEKGMEEFINVVDPDLTSAFLQRFNIQTTPSIFLLDQDKRILIKGIGGSQLEEIFQEIKLLK